MTTKIFFLALFVAAIPNLSFGERGSSKPPAKHIVVIEGMKFTPDTLNLERGDTIVWVNKDIFPHTATSKLNFDSGVIEAGHSWVYIAKNKGSFSYGCTLHPTMKAAIQVR